MSKLSYYILPIIYELLNILNLNQSSLYAEGQKADVIREVD